MTLEIRSRHGDRQRPLAAPSQLRRQASLQTTSATTAQNGADIAMAFAIPSTGRSGASAFNPDPYFIGRTDVPPDTILLWLGCNHNTPKRGASRKNHVLLPAGCWCFTRQSMTKRSKHVVTTRCYGG